MDPKILLVSIPVAGAAGTGIYFGVVRPSRVVYETIQSKLERENKGKARKVLSLSSDDIWTKYKALYKSADASTKVNKVDENALPSWCETTLKKVYSSEENSTYDKASEWCVANTNTLKAELESVGLRFISFESTNTSSWENAWTKYNGDKGTLTIEDSQFKQAPSSDATNGGPKLKAWCKAKLDKRMYEDLEEVKAIEKVKKYCVIERATV